MKIIEDDKLIVNYMEFKIHVNPLYIEQSAHGVLGLEFYAKQNNGGRQGSWENCVWMKFHTSWDWLMPVYNKLMQVDSITFATYIDSELYSYADCFEKVTQALTNGDIDEFFDAIIIFIKWVNAEKKDRK